MQQAKEGSLAALLTWTPPASQSTGTSWARPPGPGWASSMRRPLREGRGFGQEILVLG